MRSHELDPTAGTRALEIREHPEIPQPIHDPTDPRFGKVLSGAREHPSRTEHTTDATDPLYGKTSH